MVDDGSTDNTAEIMAGFQNDNLITIRYYRKAHEGKHSAYNLGLAEAKGEFFFNIDSDDSISNDCLRHLSTIAHSIRNNSSLAGYISMKSDRKGNILGNPFAWNLHVSSYIDLQRRGYKGEYSIIFLTEIARKFPFPLIKGEHFMPEHVVYNRMGNLNFFIDNNIMTICEYLPDGLSSNWNMLRYENPQGFMLCHEEIADKSKNIIQKVKNLISYNHYRNIAVKQGKSATYSGNHPVLVAILAPISKIIGFKDYWKLKREHEKSY